MMKGQARWSGLVMGFDTHMIAGAVPALRPARPTQPNITNRSNPHYDETLAPAVTLPPPRTAPPLASLLSRDDVELLDRDGVGGGGLVGLEPAT